MVYEDVLCMNVATDREYGGLWYLRCCVYGFHRTCLE